MTNEDERCAGDASDSDASTSSGSESEAEMDVEAQMAGKDSGADDAPMAAHVVEHRREAERRVHRRAVRKPKHAPAEPAHGAALFRHVDASDDDSAAGKARAAQRDVRSVHSMRLRVSSMAVLMMLAYWATFALLLKEEHGASVIFAPYAIVGVVSTILFFMTCVFELDVANRLFLNMFVLVVVAFALGTAFAVFIGDLRRETAPT